MIVAEDQEQVDKALSLKDKLPKLRWIVFDDPRGLWAYDDPMLRSFESVLEEGRAYGKANPAFYAAELAKGGADDIAMIAYTSGTTGSPKGVMLSHRNMIAAAEAFIEVNDTKPGDNWLSYLPMAWVGDAAFSLGMALAGKLVANCPESPESVQRDLRELGPNAHAGAAAHLGEHADHDAGQGRRRLAGQAPRVRAFPRPGRALRAEAHRRQAARRSASGSASRSASSSSTARCATSSACAMRAGATPAARRSGPTPIASSARSASTSSRSTARPRPRR